MTPIHLRNETNIHDHMSLIEHLASWLKPERYLEVGVWHGDNLKRVQKYAKECYGIDTNFLTKDFNSNVKLFEMTSDEFFWNLDPKIEFDMVFIDGDHDKYQVYKDFVNCKDRVISDGLVLMHDTVPANLQMTDKNFCHNSWEAAKKIKQEFRDEWEILSLPFNPGITIMRKMPWNKQLIWK